MISIWTGLPRAGKTVHAVEKIIPQLRMGRRVITNTPIWCPLPNGKKIFAEFYDDKDEFEYHALNSTGAAVFVDEMSLYFTSLRWSKLPMDWFARFRQAGKMGCDLYGTSQDFMDVTSSLRRMVDNWYFCTKKHFLGINFDFRREEFDPKLGRSVFRGWHFSLPMVFPALRVRRSFFTSMSAKNRYNSILGTSTMYPSTFRRISKCYDHEKQITASAMGKLHIFGQKGKFVKRGVALAT